MVGLYVCCLLLRGGFVWLWGHIQWCSIVTPDFALRDHSWLCLGGQMGCQGLNPDLPHAGQAPYPVCYCSPPVKWF